MSVTHPLLRLFEAWSADASADRHAIVSAVTAADFYYADPHSGPLHGRPAFLGFLNTVRTRLPDGAVQATGPVDQHEGHVRVPFALTRGGTPVRHGVYFADMDGEGRIARLVGFLE